MLVNRELAADGASVEQELYALDPRLAEAIEETLNSSASCGVVVGPPGDGR